MVNDSKEKVTEQGFARTLTPSSSSHPIAYADGMWDVVGYEKNPHLQTVMGGKEGSATQAEINEAIASEAVQALSQSIDAHNLSEEALTASEKAKKIVDSYNKELHKLVDPNGEIKSETVVKIVTKNAGDIRLVDNYVSQVSNSNVTLTNTNNEAIVAYVQVIADTLVELIEKACFHNANGMAIAETLEKRLELVNLGKFAVTTKTDDVVGQWSFPICLVG